LFFAVGDAKQSIYGWRGAKRHLLNQLPGWLGVEPESLDENRRSSPAVLRAINRLFERLDQFRCLDPDSYTEKAEKDRARVRQKAATTFLADYRTHTAAEANAALPGRVRLLVVPPTDDEEEPDEIGAILAAVEEHRRQDANREIAVLCRRRKWIPELIAGLRRRGIEASGEGGSAVADSAAAELVLSMLTWLDHPGHTLAREHVALSGLNDVFGLGASARDPSLPKRMLTDIMRRGLAAVVSGWVNHESFRRRGTAHDQVRCEQLVELARHWDAAGGGRLGRFVGRIRSQRVDNPISARVRVMTIHGSKGLEFEAVVLADLQSHGGTGSSGPRFVVTMTTPETVPRVDLLPRQDEAEWLDLPELHERYQQDQFEEDLSVLYVALTRAKSFLDVVVTAPEKTKPSLAGILTEGWAHSDAGAHVIEEAEGTAPVSARDNAEIVGRDAGIWTADRDLLPRNFLPAPNRLAAVTPSGQEGSGVVRLGQLLTMGNSQALARGTAVHALLSRLEWNEKQPSEDEWVRSIPAREADPEACRVAARELLPRLRRPGNALANVFEYDAWLERWKKDGVVKLEVWRERRFAVVLDHDLMNGSFDRVVIGLDRGGARVRAVILDFKTDRVADDAEREERRRFYQPQLEAYIVALNKLTKLPMKAIEAELVWING
jgi:ATP-dependent exoDNAse (exonuclease V) beta subunit